jgi:hypothetical protein
MRKEPEAMTTEQTITEQVAAAADAVADLPSPRIASPPSLLEVKIREDAARAAVRGTARRLEGRRRLQNLQSRSLPDDVLGYPRLDQARRLHDRLTEAVHQDIVDGATVHRRVPRFVRALPWTVAVLDGLVLYTFCADIFNVHLADAGRDGLAAMALAVLGSGISYALLTLAGTRLRDYRTKLGEIRWQQTGWFTRCLLTAAVLVAFTLGVLMYERVLERAVQAGAVYVSPDQAPVLAWIFALLSVCANLTVVAVHALDGSADGAQLRRAGRTVRRAERSFERARHRAWRRALRAEPSPDPLGELSQQGTPPVG